MQRYFIYLSYDGAAYHGWQIQPNGTSVQATLMEALSTLLRAEIEVVGAGRTDAGVHASLMVAHFDAPQSVDTMQFANKLNRLLPPDIAIHRIRPVKADAHARFNATSRTYHYYVSSRKSPFERAYRWRIHADLDYEKMNLAAERLLTYSDFTSFSKLHTDVKTNNCRVTYARWTPHDEHGWVFTITADRFLRNMVRAIVGTLVEVGRGKLSVDDFCRIIELRNRCSAGTSAPAQALFLADITYPEELFTDHTNEACS